MRKKRALWTKISLIFTGTIIITLGILMSCEKKNPTSKRELSHKPDQRNMGHEEYTFYVKNFGSI